MLVRKLWRLLRSLDSFLCTPLAVIEIWRVWGWVKEGMVDGYGSGYLTALQVG